MQTAAIAYANDALQAYEQEYVWTVSLANRKARARYLDLALAELLGNAPEAHRVAARLLSELTEVAEQQETRAADTAPVQPRMQRPAANRERPTKTVTLGLRVLLLAIVSSTAFMLTTWLTTLR